MFLVFFNTMAFAQPSPFAGKWLGKLEVGVTLRLVFAISQHPDGSFSATMDSPDQMAFNIPCDTAIITGNTVHILLKAGNISYQGTLEQDTVIKGIFTQGRDFPLVLTKTEKAVAARHRPQDPVPPFPYKSEEVIYHSKNGALQYGATITIPPGKGPFPSALLITGSGPQDRDETLMGHRVFAVLADALTRNGFIVLRVDDRGVGKSTGDFAAATSADFADDARESFAYLLSRPEVNRKKAGLIGHSEGGMIAPMIAAGNKDISFVILLAGPGIPIRELMIDQNRALLESESISPEAIAAYLPLYRQIMNEVVATPDAAEAISHVNQFFDHWLATTDPAVIAELGMKDPEQVAAAKKSMVETFSGKWFRYFLSFDPAPYLEKLSCKVLALNGSRDIQVVAGPNLTGIREALKKSKAKQYQVKEIPGKNHLFQTCQTCRLGEYGELEETFSPDVLQEINDWLNKYVK